MAVILLVCIAVSATLAAPPISDGAYRDWQKEIFDRMDFNKLQEVYPAKRSNYGSLYVSPCAAAASASMSAYTPTIAAPVQPYYNQVAYQVPAHHGHTSPHHPYYRTEEDIESEQEMLGLSDTSHVAFDHAPMARNAYGVAPMSQMGGGTGQVAASSPVVGVFSNANVGGCSVPLLVSCSPSIAHGRIVKAQPYYDGGMAPASQDALYRGVGEHLHHEEIDRHHEKAAQTPSENLSHISKPIGDKHQ